ncbi:hypothetical protein KAH27_06665 [bacterium]|nr:hypothetical protein [bacterium]
MTNRTTVTTLFALEVAVLICAAATGNYQITVNGSKHDIELGKEIVVQSKNGENIHIKIDKKKIATFQSKFVSFGHKNDMTVSSTDIDGGARQIMGITGRGTIILVQEHTKLNPAKILDLCLQGLVKDELEKGFRMTKKKYRQVLSDGTKLDGYKATLKRGKETKTSIVLVKGKRHRGVVVATSIDQDNIRDDRDVLELFWKTLTIKL